MIHPSYTELINKINDDAASEGEEKMINSRYSIVIASAKRARQIVDERKKQEETEDKRKPLSVAVEELYNGTVKIVGEDDEA